MYAEGKKTISDLEGYVEDYSDELIKTVKTYPIASILVAGGVGYIISKLMAK
jgi:preprotein translocase subunit Sss1